MPSRERKQDEIARHLMDAAIKYAASRGYRIGDGAQMHMQDLMVKAARRITYRAGRLPAKLPDAVGARSQVELVEQLIPQSARPGCSDPRRAPAERG